jgi:hypothetical protein
VLFDVGEQIVGRPLFDHGLDLDAVLLQAKAALEAADIALGRVLRVNSGAESKPVMLTVSRLDGYSVLEDVIATLSLIPG